MVLNCTMSCPLRRLILNLEGCLSRSSNAQCDVNITYPQPWFSKRPFIAASPSLLKQKGHNAIYHVNACLSHTSNHVEPTRTLADAATVNSLCDADPKVLRKLKKLRTGGRSRLRRGTRKRTRTRTNRETRARTRTRTKMKTSTRTRNRICISNQLSNCSSIVPFGRQ